MKNKGISLIVLVITIIVMIILAAAIIISLNNTGIIGNANKAVRDTDNKQIREAIEVAKLNLNFEGSLSESTLKSELQKSLGEDVEVVKNEDNSYTIKVKDMEYTLEDDESIRQYDVWDKTSTDPTNGDSKEIHIYKASELKWLSEQVAAGRDFEGYTVYLENDLDFRARESEGDTIEAKWKTDSNKEYKWTPIGNEKEKPLKADFDGKNHIIKGIYVEETTKFNGIIGCSYGTVKNLTVKNSYVEGINYTGGIAGAVPGEKIENCHNINTTVVLSDGDNYMVGGIVSTCKNANNCTNTGNVIAYGKYTDGNLSRAGGIAGVITGEKIQNCINKGTVKAEGNTIGGIVGYTSKTVENCTNYGEVICNGKDTNERSLCGGIVGAMVKTAVVTNCANYGNVSSVASYTGGITGLMAIQNDESSNKLEYCFNAGNIKGVNFVGGMAGGNGSSQDTLRYCYNKGTITATGSQYVGSIIGYNNSGTVQHLYYLSGLQYKAVRNTDYEDKNVTSTTKNINSFGEFKTWIAKFN